MHSLFIFLFLALISFIYKLLFSMINFDFSFSALPGEYYFFTRPLTFCLYHISSLFSILFLTTSTSCLNFVFSTSFFYFLWSLASSIFRSSNWLARSDFYISFIILALVCLSLMCASSTLWTSSYRRLFPSWFWKI